MSSLRDMIVSIAFKDNASKAVREVNKSMDAVKKAFETSGTSAVKTSKAVSEVGNTMKNTNSVFKRTEGGMKTTVATMRNVQSAFKKTSSGADQLSGTFRRTNSAIKNTSSAAKPVPPELTRIQKAMKTVGDASKSAVTSVSSFASKGLSKIKSAAGSGLSQLAGGFKALPGVVGGAAMSAGRSITSFITAPLRGAIGMVKQYAGALGLLSGGALAASGMNRLSAIENAKTSLTVMMGDAGKATKFMDEVLAFAKTTPFAFPDLAETSRNLIAFGMDEAKVVPTMKAIGDAAAATGKGSEGLNQVASAFGDMQIAGTLGLDQINRLQSAGVPALKILSNQFGVSTDEMKKRISSGSVDSVKSIDMLVEGMQAGTSGVAGETAAMAGIMEKTKENWTGSVDSLKSSISSTMATLIEPAKPHIQNAMAWFGDAFSKLPNIVLPMINSMKPAFSAIGDAIKTAGQAISGLFDNFGGGGFAEIKESLQSTVTFIAERLPVIKEAFSNAFNAIAPIVETVIGVMTNIRDVVSTLVQNVIVPLIPIIGDIITNVFTVIRPVIDAVGRAFELVKNVVMILVNNVIVPLIPVVSSIIETAFAIISPILRIAGTLFGVIVDVVTFLVNNVVKPLIPVVATVISGMWDTVKPILDGIVSLFEGVADAIESAVGKFKDFASVAKNFKMPKIGLPSFMGGNGLIQMGSHATGLGRVPYDEYPMFAHKDEAVLTADQSNALRSAGMLKGDGAGPTLDMGKGSTGGGGAVKSASSMPQMIFNITGENPQEIGRQVRMEIEKFFSRLNAVSE